MGEIKHVSRDYQNALRTIQKIILSFRAASTFKTVVQIPRNYQKAIVGIKMANSKPTCDTENI